MAVGPGTFSVRGGRVKKLLKLALGAVYLPTTLWAIRQRRRQTLDLLRHYPQVPELPDPGDSTEVLASPERGAAVGRGRSQEEAGVLSERE